MPRILIIGTGTVGPALAVALKSMNPVLFDSVTKFKDVGGAINLSSNGLRLVQNLGLLDKVYQEGTPMKKTSVNTVAGKPIFEFEGAPILKKYGIVNTGIKRHRLHQILLQEVEKQAIPLHLGKRLKDIQQDDKQITAIFEDGTSYSGDILIGCDGLHSRTRQILWGEDKPKSTGVEALLGLTKIDTFSHDPGHTLVYQGKGTQLGMYGIGHNEVVWFIGQKCAEASKESWNSEDVSVLAKQVIKRLESRDFHPFPIEVVSKSYRVLRYGIYDRDPLKKWSKGRATLVGDAAHPMPPHLGQGANSALEDGGVLSELLLQCQDHEKAFKIYEDLRLERTSKLVATSRQMANMYYVENSILCYLRDMALKTMFALAGGPPVHDMYSYDYKQVVKKALSLS